MLNQVESNVVEVDIAMKFVDNWKMQCNNLCKANHNLCAGWTKAGGVGRQKTGARFPWNSNPLDPPTRG